MKVHCRVVSVERKGVVDMLGLGVEVYRVGVPDDCALEVLEEEVEGLGSHPFWRFDPCKEGRGEPDDC